MIEKRDKSLWVPERILSQTRLHLPEALQALPFETRDALGGDSLALESFSAVPGVTCGLNRR